MDKWKFFDIVHREHVLCNPMSLEKFQFLISLLRLQPGSQVLEIAAGKGEFIIQLAERYDISGVGVDMSPYCVAQAQAKLRQRIPDADITFLEMDGAKFLPTDQSTFDLSACIGAGWVFGGHEETLKALMNKTKRGGYVVVGEPHWLQVPDPAYLVASGLAQDSYGTHWENMKCGENLGLTLIYTMVSNQDDWDHYEGLGWYAADDYARAHPEDPDVPVLLERIAEGKHEYLRWGRAALGWAIYVFRNV